MIVVGLTSRRRYRVVMAMVVLLFVVMVVVVFVLVIMVRTCSCGGGRSRRLRDSRRAVPMVNVGLTGRSSSFRLCGRDYDRSCRRW